jgi:two-component system LytT family response regulator
MKILIVDDEAIAVARTKRLLTNLGYNDILDTKEPLKAIDIIKSNEIDVCFLDINMSPINGIELANEITQIKDVFIVFITAYDEYALKGYEYGIDYILKPVEQQNISKALDKVKKYQNSTNIEKPKKLITKLGNSMYIVDPNDIYYIKADLKDSIIKTDKNYSYINKPISQIESQLGNNFFRVHRSFLVNLDKIKELTTIEQSKFVIKFDGIDDEVISSKDGAKSLREHLNM